MKREERLYDKFRKKQSVIEREVTNFLSFPEIFEENSQKILIKNLNEKCNEEMNLLFETGDEKKGSYEELIAQFHQLRDAKKNIVWHVIDDKGQKLAIRDARKALPKEERMKLGELEAYKIQILSLGRAAELMINASDETKDKKADILAIRDQIAGYFGSLRSELTKEDVNSLNGKLVNMMMKKFDIEEREAYRRLNIAKEYAGFNDKHYSISTIYQIKDKDYVETDIALSEITERQREKLGESEINPSDIKKEKWFQNLDKFRQEIIYLQKAKIADGNHVCPTQLRELPLIRNGYKKIVSEFKEEGDGEKKLVNLGSYTHTGTHYVETEDEDQRKDLMKILSDQQQSFKKPGEMMVICDLLSPTFLIKGDKKMSSALSELDREDSIHINLSQNIARLVVTQKTEGINEVLKHVLRGFNPKILEKDPFMAMLVNYLETGSTPDQRQLKKQEVNQKIANLNFHPKEKEILNIMVEIRELLDKPSFFDADNKRLQIANKFEQLSNKIRSYEEEKLTKTVDFPTREELFCKEIPNFEMIMQCKSGKDRTGVVELHNLGVAISDAKTLSDAEVEKTIALIGDMSSSVLFPGLSQGGTSGCYGIKIDADTVFSQKISAQTKEGIILNTASDNNFKYDKAEVKSEEKKIKLLEKPEKLTKKSFGEKLAVKLEKILPFSQKKGKNPEEEQKSEKKLKSTKEKSLSSKKIDSPSSSPSSSKNIWSRSPLGSKKSQKKSSDSKRTIGPI